MEIERREVELGGMGMRRLNTYITFGCWPLSHLRLLPPSSQIKYKANGMEFDHHIIMVTVMIMNMKWI